ncbi:MAG: hypothetical protein DRN05_00450 [Thermoplasmata archaeon]|nr:MAG: hypothetical protein DRN05_00450 [Thermoplasmata archaeon]
MENKNFLDAKEKALKSLEKACREKEVDHKILPILTIINKSPQYYTTSSCSGRIVLLQIPSIGDKKHARFLGKWHKTIQKHEILLSMKKAERGLIWLIAQPPILHIGSKTIESADRLIKTAILSGFKNSALKFTEKKIIVEICSTERLDAPIGENKNLFCSDEHLQLLVDIANMVVRKSDEKLQRFEKKLKNIEHNL